MTALTTKKSAATKEQKVFFRALMQTDLYALCHLLESRREHNLLSPTFHRPLCQYIQTTPYAKNLYLLPRGHFKTSILTIAKNIQRILNNPQIRILISSNKAENAEAMLSELKGHLLHDKLLWAFPDILSPDPVKQYERWTSNAVTVKRPRRLKEATIEAIGVTGELTSKHYDHATFDDIVGKENSQTRDLLLGVIEFLRMAQPLMDPGATQDYVGTTWHYADVWAWLLEQKHKHGMPLGTYIMPCWKESPRYAEHTRHVPGYGWVCPVFPERFSIDGLLEERATMGPSAFAAQYLLNPISADTTILPRDKLRVIPRADLPPISEMWVAMTVDPAISTTSDADYSALAVGGFDRDNVLYILDLQHRRCRESELIEMVYRAKARYPTMVSIGFERTGFQKIFMRLFASEGERRGIFLPIIGLEKDTNKTKQTRIRALEPLWINGQLVVVNDVPALADFLDEAERFRTDRESTHDDLLDAVVDLLQLRARPQTPVRPWSHLEPGERARREFEAELLEKKPYMTTAMLREAWAMKELDEIYDEQRLANALQKQRSEFFS